MKVPLSLLKEYLDFTQTAEELADCLTLAGIEVEGIETCLDETILEVTLTPNLGHCLSIVGIARELAAQLGLPLQKKEYRINEEADPIEKYIQVHYIDKKQCPRFSCRALLGVKVGPSPDWLKKKVESYGMRSINNVVDVSNLVLLETGQPSHAFDYDKLEGKQIFITSQTEYKEMITLDDQLRAIPPNALLFCDTAKALDFAGIMGAKSSAVTDSTTNLLIVAPYVSASSIRKTTKMLGLRTEASQRFEKGTDPNAVLEALNYSSYLLQQVAGGKIAQGAIDLKSHAFEEKKILCRTERVNSILGTHLSTSEIAELLERLQMRVVEETLHTLLLSVPTYRNDITQEIDLIEEVARVYGYNHIEKPLPRHVSSTLANAPLYTLEKTVRTLLIAEGLQELLTCDLISPTQAERTLENTLKKDAIIEVLHSHSVDQSVLRTTLLSGLLQAVQYNIDHGTSDIAAFELGRVHFKEKDAYLEPMTAGIILSGKQSPHHWDTPQKEWDFFDLKGILENLFAALHIEDVTWETAHLHNFHPHRQARLKKGETLLGVLGEIHPKHLAWLDISQRILFAEINVQELLPLLPKEIHMTDLPQYPGSVRDWTILLPDKQPIETILRALRSVPSSLLESVTLLDLYKSEQIGKDKKNATFRFLYRDRARTLSFEEVETEHARILATVSVT